MSKLTQFKVGLAVIGLVLFGAGVRLERQELRWVGLAFVVLAWLMRFVGRRKPEDSNSGSD